MTGQYNLDCLNVLAIVDSAFTLNIKGLSMSFNQCFCFCFVMFQIYTQYWVLDHIVASSFNESPNCFIVAGLLWWLRFQIYLIYQSHIYKTAKRSVVTRVAEMQCVMSLSLNSHDNENNLYNTVMMDSCLMHLTNLTESISLRMSHKWNKLGCLN